METNRLKKCIEIYAFNFHFNSISIKSATAIINTFLVHWMHRRGRSQSSRRSRDPKRHKRSSTLSGSESDSDIQSGKIHAHAGDLIYDRCKIELFEID